jgi:SAM-dependent methyltransferase
MTESTPPWKDLIRLLTGKWTTNLLYLAVELDLADALRNGPSSAEEVADRTKTKPAITSRILRALSSMGLVEQIDETRFGLTALGGLLCRDTPRSLNHLVRMVGSPWHNRLWESVVESARSGRAGAEEAFGTNMWAYFDAHQADGQNFDAAMTEVSNTFSADAVDVADFSGISRLVDVGGGRGQLLARILRRYPDMVGVVFDRPGVEEGARALIQQQGLADRCSFVGGDFLHSVAEGGDGYMICHTLHNWSDPDAVRILRNCRAAIKPRGKLMVLDIVIKPPGEPDWGKLMDVEMLAMFGGRERTPEEFAKMFQESGFVLERVVRTPSSTSIVQGSAV